METKLIFLDEIISLVKEKKELAPLDDEFVKEVILQDPYMIKKDYDSFDQFKRSSVCKSIVSSTRKKLRDVYGLFLNTPLSKKHVERLVSTETVSLLSLHKSTQERVLYYPTIYPLLFEKLHQMGLKKEYVLADIACGYNPLAYKYLPSPPKNYVAVDLSSRDMEFLQLFFDKFDLKGEAHAYNVLGTSFYQFIEDKKFDVVFLFKALDPFELVKRNSSKKLLSTLQSTFFVVSFSLYSIGGKVPIDVSKRSWFEKFCVKQGWEYETMQIPNELFYVVKTGN